MRNKGADSIYNRSDSNAATTRIMFVCWVLGDLWAVVEPQTGLPAPALYQWKAETAAL